MSHDSGPMVFAVIHSWAWITHFLMLHPVEISRIWHKSNCSAYLIIQKKKIMQPSPNGGMFFFYPAYPSNYGGCQTFSSKSSLPAGPSHGHSSRKTHSKREPDSNTSHNKSHSSSSSAIAKNSNTPQPPTRGSIHCLVREEQERRGRDKSPSGNNSPKKTLTTFASPPSYEACVRENINGSNESVNSGPRSDKKPNGAASCEPRTKSADPLQHIAEEEDCSDFNGDSNQEVDPQELCQEIDNLFFKSVVV